MILLNEIKKIEKKLGRIKTVKNDPRIIDIDIIDFNSKIKNTEQIDFTSSKMSYKKFCFIPNFRN